MREWDRVKDDKIELETKKDMKERTGRSPDLADWCAGIVEMARRKGFQISKLENEEAQGSNNDWLRDLRKDQRQMNESKALSFA